MSATITSYLIPFLTDFLTPWIMRLVKWTRGRGLDRLNPTVQRLFVLPVIAGILAYVSQHTGVVLPEALGLLTVEHAEGLAGWLSQTAINTVWGLLAHRLGLPGVRLNAE